MRRGGEAAVDLTARIGPVTLANPVMPASGTAGNSDELATFADPRRLGAVVTKSLCVDPWPGNPSPRVHQATAGMINSVGLQGPGVAAWLDQSLPAMIASGATVVGSIWGRTIDDYVAAAELMAGAPAEVVAVEVNLSCPNLDGGAHLFAHDPDVAAEVIAGCARAMQSGTPRPLWAKLSANTHRMIEVAGVVHAAGASAVTLINTMMGMAIDVERRAPVLGAGGGGLSGPAIRPIAVRAVYDVHAAHPELPIVGVGGIASAEDAVEHLMAGASAVQIGTAGLADPRATVRILDELRTWCSRHGIAATEELVGSAHRV